MSCTSRRGLAALLGGLSAALRISAAHAVEWEHRLALHVDEHDPQRMNLVRDNAQNLVADHREQGIPVRVRIVAYGPGLPMLRADISPAKDRISAMSLGIEGLSFAACANTMKAMARREGREPPILREAEVVPSGVVELVELQRQGWAYERP